MGLGSTRKKKNFQIDPKKLKEDISILTQNIAKMTENKVFFETLLEEKLKKYIKILKRDSKDSKNADIVKKCLSVIHKHYESRSKSQKHRPQPHSNSEPRFNEFDRNVASGLRKIELEIQLNEERYNTAIRDNNERQRKLLMSMNNKEILQVPKRKQKSITKQDVERRKVEAQKTIETLTKKNIAVKRILDSEIYNLTLSHEKKGRDIMQEKVIELALESVKEGGEEQETIQLSEEVEILFGKVKDKSKWIQNSEYDVIMNRKKDLEERVKMLQKIIKA